MYKKTILKLMEIEMEKYKLKNKDADTQGEEYNSLFCNGVIEGIQIAKNILTSVKGIEQGCSHPSATKKCIYCGKIISPNTQTIRIYKNNELSQSMMHLDCKKEGSL